MKQHLIIAYNTLSTMLVNGDNVDLLAAVKQHLRLAIAECKEEATEQNVQQENTRSTED